MSCITLQNPVQLKKNCRGEFMEWLRYVIISILSIGVFIISYRLFYKRKRLSDCFVDVNGTIVQSVNKSGRKFINDKRKSMKNENLKHKFYIMGKFFKDEIQSVISKLEVGKIYNIHSHILSQLQRQAKKYNDIEIISFTQTNHKFLKESIVFLGFKDFFKVLFSKDKDERKRLFKTFHKIKFKRTK